MTRPNRLYPDESDYSGMCPDCGNRKLVRRTTEWIGPTFQVVYWACLDSGCGSRFSGTSEITHRMSMPGLPSSVCLPFTEEAMKRVTKAEMEIKKTKQKLLEARSNAR